MSKIPTVEIQRLAHNEKQTIGELSVFDGPMKIFKCKTIELPPKQNRSRISRIPAGTYPLIKVTGSKLQWSRFDYEHPWIKDVPNRSGIKIHIANYYSQLAGCVAVGESFSHVNSDGFIDLTNSENTLEELVKIMPSETKIKIIDEKPIEKADPAGLINELKNVNIDPKEFNLV